MQFATIQPVTARTDLPVITDEEAAAKGAPAGVLKAARGERSPGRMLSSAMSKPTPCTARIPRMHSKGAAPPVPAHAARRGDQSRAGRARRLGGRRCEDGRPRHTHGRCSS